MKTRHHQECIAAYKRTLKIFGHLGRRPSFQRLNNETSAPLEAFALATTSTYNTAPHTLIGHSKQSVPSVHSRTTSLPHCAQQRQTFHSPYDTTCCCNLKYASITYFRTLPTSRSPHTPAYMVVPLTSPNILSRQSVRASLFTIVLLLARRGLPMASKGSTSDQPYSTTAPTTHGPPSPIRCASQTLLRDFPTN